MRLRDLLVEVEYECLQGDLEGEIGSLVYDSRKVEPGCAFVCLRGASFDGHDFAAQAVEKGAAALIVEADVRGALAEGKNPDADEGTVPEMDGAKVTVIKVANTREALAITARNFFGNPSAKLKISGLTRPKGK
ncbi:MAG: hypothetical protein J6Z33_10460, partial [Lachnospiraceae bacterium]|nr:hypothetical protein [Lachnospiraceae bacterium]